MTSRMASGGSIHHVAARTGRRPDRFRKRMVPVPALEVLLDMRATDIGRVVADRLNMATADHVAFAGHVP